MRQGHYRYATFMERTIALVIDSFIVGVISAVVTATKYLVMLVEPNFYKTTAGIISIIMTLFGFAYFIYFLSKKGQTPGKRLLGIYTVRQKDGLNLSVGESFLREVVLKTITFLSLFGFLTYFFTKRKQCLHDIFINSINLKEESTQPKQQQTPTHQEETNLDMAA